MFAEFAMDPPLLDYDAHHNALALLGARALVNGHPKTAFLLADRRCRVLPLAGPEHLVLRAEAAWRLGHHKIAIDSLRAALEIDPQHRQANRRMLAWGTDEEKISAAKALLHCTREEELAADALRGLAHCDEQIYVSVALLGSEINGWAAWRDEAKPSLRLLWEQGGRDISLRSDPRHPLAGIIGNAVSFSLEWPAGASEVTLDTPGIRGFVAGSPLVGRYPIPLHSAGTDPPQHLPVSVIIPVYADFAATKACLETVLAPGVLPAWAQVLVIDDLSPEPAIAEMLDTLADRGLITLIRNQRNLGFVGSINRALQSIPNGDIILLNADTIVPPKFAERLLAAAHSAPDIATVTPLSNNGEITSFPLPFEPNPLPDQETIFELDRIAAEVNAGKVVTIPNGIGFCLYIRRDCLARIGTLSKGVRRGYLEDVEFCLRARRYGLRNVCAASVYVGHAGGKSFQQEKRALVVSNLKPLESEYPHYRAECAAFIAIDPLRSVRDSIQLASVSGDGGDLLICGTGPAQEIAWARAKTLARGGTRVVVAELGPKASSTIALSEATGKIPQRLEFALDSEKRALLLAHITDQRFERIEISDPPAVPLDLARDLAALHIPLDFFIANGGLYCPRQTLSVERARNCGTPTDPKFCDLCVSRLGAPAHIKGDVASWRREWRSLLEKARTIWIPDDRSAFFELMFPTLCDRVRICPPEDVSADLWNPGGRRLGLIPLDQSSTDLDFVLSLARAFQRIGSDRELIVLGQTFDDLRVMACGNAFVSGSISSEEVPSLLTAFEVGGVLLGTGKALFGHPTAAAAVSSGVPTTRLCWGPRQPLTKQHVILDPLASFEEWAVTLDQWLSTPGHSRGAAA
jgi:GT2 family glycosyltransferase